MKRVCVFCGSKAGEVKEYAAVACRLGRLLAERRLGLVFGGGHIGLMGVLADAVLGVGGEAIGVIPQALVDRELAHGGLTQLHVVATMHERKAVMADLADAFLALPGGFGTADELFEILTWAQLGLHSKPVGVVNIAGFFTPLLAWLDHTVATGFLKPAHRRLVLEADEPGRLLDLMLSYKAPTAGSPWIPEGDR
jgi:uncharacterized protein (TIGR00730 family)